jgi:hypothetical protein
MVPEANITAARGSQTTRAERGGAEGLEFGGTPSRNLVLPHYISLSSSLSYDKVSRYDQIDFVTELNKLLS